MKVNRNNYMLYFLDYFEGALSAEQQEELMHFLDDHADLKAEFNDFEMVYLPVDKDQVYNDKFSLKKPIISEGLSLQTGQKKPESPEQDAGTSPFLLHKEPFPENFEITPENYEEVFAAYAEGDLTDDQALAAETFASSDAFYQRELDIIKAARFEADSGIEFRPKSALKKYFIGQVTRAIRQYGSVAAAILLLAVFVFSLLPLTDSDRIAHETPVAGDQEGPEAVAVTPAPQQDVLQDVYVEMDAHGATAAASHEMQELDKINGRRAIAGLQARNQHTDSHPQPHIRSAIEIDLTAFRRQPVAQQLQPPLTMETRPAAPLVASAERHPASIETREEYIWLAFRDASELHWLGDLADAHHQEVSLGELAINRLSETANLNPTLIDDVISGDRSVLFELVNSGINRLAPASVGLLGIETSRDKDGRITYLGLGQGFSISRK